MRYLVKSKEDGYRRIVDTDAKKATRWLDYVDRDMMLSDYEPDGPMGNWDDYTIAMQEAGYAQVSGYHDGQSVRPVIEVDRFAGRPGAGKPTHRVRLHWHDASDKSNRPAGTYTGTRDECEKWLKIQGVVGPDL